MFHWDISILRYNQVTVLVTPMSARQPVSHWCIAKAAKLFNGNSAYIFNIQVSACNRPSMRMSEDKDFLLL